MNINLNLYKYFYFVAKNKSFTKTAEELMISQPSLSYSVKILEEQLKKELIVRTPKGIELTSDGADLYNKLLPIINELDSICNEDYGMNGTVRIGVRTFYSQHVLPNKIQLLQLLYPELKIEFKVGKSNELHEFLRNKQVDLILDEEKEDGALNVIVKSEKSPLVFFTSVKRDLKEINKDVLKNESILNVNSNKFTLMALSNYPEIRIENIYSTPAMIEEIKYKNRIGFSATFLVKDFLKMNDIKIVDSNYVFDDSNFALYASYFPSNKSLKIDNVINVFKDYNYEDTINVLENQ